MIKIQDIFLFHMFQAILYIDYLNFSDTKLQNYPKFQENVPYLLDVVVSILLSISLGLFVIFKNKSPSLLDHSKTMLTYICYLVLKLLKI